MKTQTVLSLVALLILLAAPLRAQDQEASDRWSAEVGLALNSTGGNQDLTAFTTNLGLTRLETAAYELSFNSRFRYGHSEGERVAQNLYGELSLDLWPSAAWSPFLFANGEQDPFKRLDVRFNGGAGVKRTFWQSDWSEVSASGAVLYSYEDLSVPDSLGDGITQTARWSVRTRVRQQISEGSRFEQTVFFQPAWNELDDYLLESMSNLRVALSEQLSLTTTLLYQRDNTPAEDVKPDDYSLSVGLSLATEW